MRFMLFKKDGFERHSIARKDFMDKIKKILAPTDLSKLSQAGVRHALNLARISGAEVTVYHAVGPDEIMGYAQNMEERMANAVFRPSPPILENYQLALSRFLKDHFSLFVSQVEIREKVELGAPDKNIIEQAKKEGADLIVMSTHGRTGLSHVLVGSVTEKVIRGAPCPVLSIHPKPAEKRRKRLVAVA